MDVSKQILSDITVYSKYARFKSELNRRETWPELIDRNRLMHIKKYPAMEEFINTAYNRSVLPKKVLPSMRSLQFAGVPIERSPSRIYNCAYLPIEDIDAFAEIMFLLLGGTGVGYSVQSRHVNKLPDVVGPKPKSRRYVIGDSIEGWADAVKVLVESYYQGKTRVKFDYDDIREKGTELVTSGGKAPGPEPLRRCLQEVERVLSQSIGRKLRPIEAHDIACFLADAVLAGGIRRAAMISLFSMDDDEMIVSKANWTTDSYTIIGPAVWDEKYTEVIVHGVHQPFYSPIKEMKIFLSESDLEGLVKNGTTPWYCYQPQRARANNSVVLLRGYVTRERFDSLWDRVHASGAGEPGFYWTNDLDWGTNPCCEIALRPYQFCNLTEINASDIVDQEDFNNRARDAALIGTLQAGYTDFHYLRPIWKETTEKDALVGVGITGIASNAIAKLNEKEAADVAVATNLITSAIIGINSAARVTTIKPSGTSSLVVGSSSGIHAWHSPYYVRRMRFGKDEAIYQYLAKEFPALVEDEFFRPNEQGVVSIPQRAPEGASVRTETPLELLERVKRYNLNWVRAGHQTGANTNNVSCTISLKEEEWESVGEWMWDNQDTYNGISVIPYDGGSYKQTPFEDITAEEFEKLNANVHDIDITKVVERADNTNLAAEAACAGGACEIGDFV